MSDNAIARRVLGANLKGMPRYEPVGEFSTFALLPRGQGRAGARHRGGPAGDLRRC